MLLQNGKPEGTTFGSAMPGLSPQALNCVAFASQWKGLIVIGGIAMIVIGSIALLFSQRIVNMRAKLPFWMFSDRHTFWSSDSSASWGDSSRGRHRGRLAHPVWARQVTTRFFVTPGDYLWRGRL
jgi:hypothetical protein